MSAQQSILSLRSSGLVSVHLTSVSPAPDTADLREALAILMRNHPFAIAAHKAIAKAILAAEDDEFVPCQNRGDML